MAQIVSDDDWRAAREALLAEEKALTRHRDEVTRLRSAMPWRRVNEDYVFAGEHGEVSLSSLFDGRSQLIVVHFMFAPGWQEGCRICSFWADQYDAMRPHLAARDVSLAVVSRAPVADLAPFRARMGWRFPWVSSAGNTFNTDYQVSFPGGGTGEYNYRETKVMAENPGISVFARDGSGDLFHTYSVYARGLDPMNATYQFLDLVPAGRNEGQLTFPMAWVNFHDRY